MRTKKTTPRQTSDRVSRIAARLLENWEVQKQWNTGTFKRLKSDPCDITWGDALALAASCLAQDQVKGKRVTKRRGRR
jgi:hypothetical protein